MPFIAEIEGDRGRSHTSLLQPAPAADEKNGVRRATRKSPLPAWYFSLDEVLTKKRGQACIVLAGWKGGKHNA